MLGNASWAMHAVMINCSVFRGSIGHVWPFFWLRPFNLQIHQWPGAQRAQTTEPGAFANVPGVHRLQAALPLEFEYVPATQLCGVVLAGAQECPIGQGLQSALLVRFWKGEYVPAGQAKATEEPAGQKCPSKQLSAFTVALDGQSSPAGHRPAQMMLA